MKRTLLGIAVLTLTLTGTAKEYTLSSPDGRLMLTVTDGLTYTLTVDGTPVITDGAMGLSIEGEDKARVRKARTTSGADRVEPFLYRQKTLQAEYNAMTLTMDKGLTVELRAYDQGVAYRFTASRKDSLVITDETARFGFADDYTAYLPHTTNEKKPMAMAFQSVYEVKPLSQSKRTLAFLPAMVDCGVCKVTLMESDLEAYPGMFVEAEGQTLKGVFAHYPKETDRYPWRQQVYVTATEDHIAQTAGTRTMPWRILAVSRKDEEMPLNDLVYLLASPNRTGDTDWIKPGKVAWDWWNDWGLQGVDFKAGINTETYKHFIEFAAGTGLEYIILDEGWYDPKSGDMLTVVPDVDLEAIVDYGKENGVGVILWTVYNVLDEQLDEACQRYAAMGVRGFKVDFMDRDDQTAVEMIYRIAEKCAEHHLVLDYHGIYKPTGINRTYPNIINFESVFGMEEAKWTEHDAVDMPLYDVTFPFIRMQCGPVDFTPGGMRNATKADFQPVYSNPMTMGTRCHQAAMYVVHDSPLTMLADSPTAYAKDATYTSYIAGIPTDFDETIIPMGKLGKYIVTARRLGNDWYVGGQTNWDARELALPLNFLGDGRYEAELLTDGVNANKVATDYRIVGQTVDKGTTLNIDLASGGGFVIKLKKK